MARRERPGPRGNRIRFLRGPFGSGYHPPMFPLDTLSRPLRDLRISVTDRCNFRCRYCMPKEVFGREYRFLERSELLSYEEIEHLARVFIALGVTKIRLTGGEPLMRRDLPRLVARLARLDGLRDLSLTTNGVLLPGRAEQLAEAGLKRVTVSLDSLEEGNFRTISDAGVPVARVLAGIDAAAEAGLTPVKVNVVVRKDLNAHEIVPIARHFRGTGVIVRFIEYMDVGNSNRWRLGEVVPSAEVIERIARVFPLQPVGERMMGRVAERWRYEDGEGEVGVISSVSSPFCRGCTRARLSPEGRLYLCLFAGEGIDLRTPLREGAGQEELAGVIRGHWQGRRDRYSELRHEGGGEGPKIEMSHIGG